MGIYFNRNGEIFIALYPLVPDPLRELGYDGQKRLAAVHDMLRIGCHAVYAEGVVCKFYLVYLCAVEKIFHDISLLLFFCFFLMFIFIQLLKSFLRQWVEHSERKSHEQTHERGQRR